VGDSSNNNSVTVCSTVFIPLSLKALQQQCDKHSVTCLNESRMFCSYRVFSATAAQRACCAVCVVNSSQCVGGSAAAVGMLAVSSL